MARSEARIKVRIWEDDDFLALDGPEKLVYLFLISQPDIAHTGVLPLRVKRWANKLKFTTGQLEKVLAHLEDARFVVADYDEEELFVRSFIRNDEVYKQPKVLLAAVRQIAEISSKLIRGVLSFEIQRLLEEGLPGENTRPTLLKMVGILGRALAFGVKPQVNTLSDTHPGTHGGTPSEGYAEDVPEGYAVPNAMPTGVGVGVGDGFEVVVTSSSSPSGEAENEASHNSDEQAPQRPAADAAKRGTRVPDGFTFTTEMQAWAKEKTPLVADDLSLHTEMFVDYWLGRSDKLAVKRDWIAAWRNWLRKANKDAAERAARRGEQPGRQLAPATARCPKHKRQPAPPLCQTCDAEKRGAA
ncbi:hypothetical protein [Glycomyces artemisiae]|uniref:hypothetical protein n=1 Tax=Glycomyces artemisiae TaxID=1076443 RepID=UPI0011B2972F|nr:hypothetical protein [Glycomyces artemisiae]